MSDPQTPMERAAASVTHNDIYLMLGRLEGKVDAFLKTAEDHHKQLEVQDRKIRELEKSKWTMTGAASAIAVIVSSAATWLVKGQIQ